MTWLLSFIVAHAVQIAAIGTVAGTIASVESVVINTMTIEEKYRN